MLVEAELYPGRADDSLYVQSLRSHPQRTNEATALVNYRDCDLRELVHVKFTGSGIEDRVYSVFRGLQGEEPVTGRGAGVGAAGLELLDLDNPLCTFPSRQLATDMANLRQVARSHETGALADSDKDGGMASLVVDGEAVRMFGDCDADDSLSARRYSVHSFVLQARCPLLFEHLEGLRVRGLPPEVPMSALLEAPSVDLRVRCTHFRDLQRRAAQHGGTLAPLDATMSLLCDFLYTGVLGTEEDKGGMGAAGSDVLTLGSLLWVAGCCGLSELATLVESQLAACLDVNTCLAVAELSVLLARPALTHRCRHFLTTHWDWIAGTGGVGAGTEGVANDLLAKVGSVLAEHRDHYCSLVSSLAPGAAAANTPPLSGAYSPPLCNGHTVTVMGRHLVVVGGRDVQRCYSCRRIHMFALDSHCWSLVSTDGPGGSCCGPSNQFYHVAVPLRHTGGAAGGAADGAVRSGRYLLCLGGRVVTSSTATKDREAYILDCSKMQWVLPDGEAVGAGAGATAGAAASADEIGGAEIVDDMSIPTRRAGRTLPAYRSLMCHTVMAVHGQNTPSTLSKYLLFGGYRYESRSISSQTFLVVVTARLADADSGRENVASVAAAGEEGDSLQFEITAHGVTHSSSMGAGEDVQPGARMNHSCCRCMLYNDEGSGMREFDNAHDTALRMLVYGGVGACYLLFCAVLFCWILLFLWFISGFCLGFCLRRVPRDLWRRLCRSIRAQLLAGDGTGDLGAD